MNNTIDIFIENSGISVDSVQNDSVQSEILVSLSRDTSVDVDNVAPSITVDFGSLPQNVYWDEIQDKPNFHPVATSGDYDDLENKPNLHPVATSGDYDDLENKPNLSEVATSGNYGDLNGKPSINNVTLNGNKSAADLGLATASQGAKADTAYQKPVDGIPSSDMTAAVRESLGKADTALQEHQSLEGYATETWVEDQGYLTEHQDISGKQDTLVSGQNIKTINGESILGSGDLVIEGGGGGTGDYDDLDNKPSINNVTLTGNKTAAQLGLQETLTIDPEPTEDSTNPVQSGGVYDALQDKADKVSGATAGNLAALDSNGNLTDSGFEAHDFITYSTLITELGYKADIVNGATNGNFAGLDAGGNLTDSGSKASDFATAAQGTKADNAIPMPSGGSTGQVLKKTASGVEWANESGGGGGTATDVQINGTSITSNDVANIITEGTYNASTNKIATMSDLPSVPVTDVTVGGTSVVSSGTAVIPAIPDVTGKADKVSSATNGNFAGLDANGNLTDSGHKHSDYLTSHQDISGKEDKTNKVTSLSSSSTDTQYPSAKVVYDQLATKQATLVSGTNIKTVNNTSLLGNGNLALALQSQGITSITTQQDGSIVFTFANGDTTTVDLNHTHPNYYKKTAETSQPSGGMLPDVIYTLGTLTGATTFTFAAAVSGNLNHYYFTFTSGSTAVVPTWPASITSWDGNCVDSTTGLPVIAANKTYEVSVLDGNAIIKEW